MKPMLCIYIYTENKSAFQFQSITNRKIHFYHYIYKNSFSTSQTNLLLSIPTLPKLPLSIFQFKIPIKTLLKLRNCPFPHSFFFPFLLQPVPHLSSLRFFFPSIIAAFRALIKLFTTIKAAFRSFFASNKLYIQAFLQVKVCDCCCWLIFKLF